METVDDVLRQADKAFSELDKAQRAAVAAENKLRELRSRYGAVTGTHGIRLEGLRRAVDVRAGRRAA